MIETATKPYRLASGEGLADVWWKTGRVTVKVAGAETGNAFSQIEVDDPRGGGTPPARPPQRGRNVLRPRGRAHVLRRRRADRRHCGRLPLRPARHPSRLRRPLGARTHPLDDQPRGNRAALRLPRHPGRRRRTPDRHGDAADARDDTPVRRPRRRDPRPPAVAQRPLLASRVRPHCRTEPGGHRPRPASSTVRVRQRAPAVTFGLVPAEARTYGSRPA